MKYEMFQMEQAIFPENRIDSLLLSDIRYYWYKTLI